MAVGYGRVLDVLLTDSLLETVGKGVLAVSRIDLDVDGDTDGTKNDRREKMKKITRPTLLCCWPAPRNKHLACPARTPDARVLECIIVKENTDSGGTGDGDDWGTSKSAAVPLLEAETGQSLLLISLPTSFTYGGCDTRRKRTRSSGTGTEIRTWIRSVGGAELLCSCGGVEMGNKDDE